MNGLESIQGLVQEEGGVIDQHVQVAVEGRVLSLITRWRVGEEEGRMHNGSHILYYQMYSLDVRA